MPNDYFNPPNSVWPNGLKKDNEGYTIFHPLGTNKVDISTVTWPKGDTLISPFVYENDKLVGFVDTKALIVSGNTTSTMYYSHIEADFASIEEGTLIINAPNASVKEFKWAVAQNNDGSFDYIIIDFNATDQATIDAVRTAQRVVDNKLYDGNGGLIGTIDTSKIENGGIFDEEAMKADGLFCNVDLMTFEERGLILSEFNSDLSSLKDSSWMFTYCSNLVSFSSDLPSLTYSYMMFCDCSNLTSFSSGLPSLTDGTGMFTGCSNLTSFSSDSSGSPVNLSNLTNGNQMFCDCSNLTSFSSDLPSLTYSYMMFCDCSNLTSFSSDLPSLTDGNMMFAGCSNLVSFSSGLPSLTNGNSMFNACKLDTPSVKNIIDTINTYSDELALGMGCNSTMEDRDLFAQEVGYANMTSLLAALQAKGWTVEVQYNGRPTTTYDLRKPSQDTLPVFVKLEETAKRAEYISEDGSKKYRLDWFHETTGSTDGYTQFNTIEEAIETLNIKPIEK